MDYQWEGLTPCDGLNLCILAVDICVFVVYTLVQIQNLKNVDGDSRVWRNGTESRC